jgi:hypothetical protein
MVASSLRQSDFDVQPTTSVISFGTRDTLSSVPVNWTICEAISGMRNCDLAVAAMICRRSVLIALGWTGYAPRAQARD